MRIGIDLLAAQSPHHGKRGIGRYARGLISGLIGNHDSHEYVLYRYPGLTDAGITESGTGKIIWRDMPDNDRAEAAPELDLLIRENPDDLDAFLIISPFECWRGYLPPTRDDASSKPLLIALIHDTIPFLFPPDRAPLHPDTRRLGHAARALQRFDGFLANSESTRSDSIRYFGISPDRITNVGAATDGFRSSPAILNADSAKSRLGALGVNRPFIFCVGGMDPRKNTHGLLESFSRLPVELRRTTQLVVACDFNRHYKTDLLTLAKGYGITDSLVLTGEVSDAMLEILYRECSVFAFPSIYEGFGLPVLEAMQCGAPVVVGNNSSLPEVVGDAGVLVDAADPDAFAASLARVLVDDSFARSLRTKAVAHSKRFAWSKSAEKAREAIERLASMPPAVRMPIVRLTRAKPRIAMVSPLPPRGSGISDYTANLVEELRHHYQIDLYHDGAYTPLPSLSDPELVHGDIRLLPRIAAVRDYRSIVYQMGNSRFHQYFYSTMLQFPGVVTLHDYCLAGFHQAYNRLYGVPSDHFVSQLEYGHSGRYDEVLPLLSQKPVMTEEVSRVCAENGLWVNRRVFEAAETVIFHSPWCIDRAAEQSRDFAAKCVMIPHGATPQRASREKQLAIRERFQLPQDALIIGSFGFIHPDKLSPEAIKAFASIASTYPNALKVFVGMEVDGGVVRETARETGILDRVRFLGRRSAEEFEELAAITDIGISLRRPPTNGETSGALLNLLRWGVPTIVTDVGTFADYPDSTVLKVKWPDDGEVGLAAAMSRLAGNERTRAAFGNAAFEHVCRYHEWPTVAAQYAEVIEAAYEKRQRSSMRGAS